MNKPKASTPTKPKEPVTPVKGEPFEYIVIVGTENYHRNAANKAMFMHAALRELKTYPSGASSKRVVMLFPVDYSTQLRAAFKKACLAKSVKAADYIELNTKDDLVGYINSRKAAQIKQVDIFSHGQPGALLFGLSTGLDANMDMYNSDVALFKPLPFSPTAVITSYACQTANGSGKDNGARQNNSIARAMATATQTTVKAYMRKTTYEGVLGDAAMRQDYYEYSGNLKRLKDPRDAWELTETEKKRGKALEDSIDRRQKVGSDKVDFDPEGAILPVKADNTPADVPATLYVFEPAKRKS